MARAATEFLGGLQLAVDRKLVQKPAVVSGKNFVVEIEGPRSGFAFESMYDKLWHDDYLQSFRFSNYIIYIGRRIVDGHVAFYFLNWPKRQWEVLDMYTGLTTYIHFPFTFAMVGGKYYFAHREVGVIEFDKTTLEFTDVTSYFPANTFYIAESAGRCIAVSPGFASWSAIDNARDFTPSTVTGAGAQSLALTGTPSDDNGYLGLQSTASGFLVFLDSGVLKATIINSALIFRFANVEDGKIPFSQLCISKLSQSQIVVLAKDGLWITNGQKFEAWQPLMSEYLKRQVIPKLQEETIGQIQLHYAKLREWFFISYTFARDYGTYQHADVSYLPRQEWGSFDITHKGFVEVDLLNDGSNFESGFIDVNGHAAVFNDLTANIELLPQDDSSPSDLQSAVFYADELFDKTSYKYNAVHRAVTNSRGSSDWLVHDSLANEKVSWPTQAGFFELYGAQELLQDVSEDSPIDATVVIDANNIYYPATNSNGNYHEVQVYKYLRQDVYQTSLACEFLIGPFRFTDNNVNDQLSLISKVAISMTDVGDSAIVRDWLTEPNPDVVNDWMANPNGPDVINDWGYGIADGSNYLFTGVGTLDGYKEFLTEEYNTYDLEGKTRFYSTDFQGIYNFINLQALGVNDYMHLKLIETTGILAGRL